MFVDVAAAADLQEGQPFVVKLRGREIVLVRWGDDIFALRNVCPHETQSFECGVVHERFSSSMVGDVDVETGSPIIACPWHRWQFDVATGKCLTDPSYRIRKYEAKINGDRVFVEVDRAPRNEIGRGEQTVSPKRGG